METFLSTDAVAWIALVLVVLGGGMGSMVRYYRRPLKATVLFPAPVDEPSLPMAEAVRFRFEQGCQQFQLGHFPRAIEQFMAVLEAEPGCAEAAHNVGLAQANLGNDDVAVRALLRANTLYDQQSTRAGVDAIKAQMQQLADRRRAIAVQAASRG